MTTVRTVRAVAHSNIALVKYWGKRRGDAASLNLPDVGSISMTLDDLRTQTRIEPAVADRFVLQEGDEDRDLADGGSTVKVFAHLDRMWKLQGEGTRPPVAVTSRNYLPTAAGLASSASGFAALTVAANAAFELGLDDKGLSQWSRMGSGSAARSVFGGFVELHKGTLGDGSDCFAEPLIEGGAWDLQLLVVHTAKGKKKVGSTGGMGRSKDTSAYYSAWVETSPADLDQAREALRARDLPALGVVMERSCFKMHACMLATEPPLMYWNGVTMDAIREVWEAREAGLEGYVTSDAGPHVKVLTRSETAPALAQRLKDVPGVVEVQAVGPGPAAHVEVMA